MNPANPSLKNSATHPQVNNLVDTFQRPLHDLRISVIDRCNFRCPYCMPEEENAQHYTFLKEKAWLRFDEIVRLTQLFVHLGVSKLRLTGGEPLLRPQLPQLIAKLVRIPGIDDLALTTNGTLLAQYAVDLKKAGLHRLTVSLDSLDQAVFERLTGRRGKVRDVLDGIEQARNAGFDDVKINVVVQRGVNDHTLMELVEYFKGRNIILRFIEYMDVGNCNHWESRHVVPSSEILQKIHARYPLRPLQANYFGEVASRYAFADGKGEIGFISSVSQPFCGSCTRARVSVDGKIYTCLFASQGTDIATALRAGASDQELLKMIEDIWKNRADKYSENRSLFQSLKEKQPKVEMFQIGG